MKNRAPREKKIMRYKKIYAGGRDLHLERNGENALRKIYPDAFCHLSYGFAEGMRSGVANAYILCR